MGWVAALLTLWCTAYNTIFVSLINQESSAIRWATAKITARCALFMDALKIFESLWVLPRLLVPKFLMGFCSDRCYECAYNIWSSYSFTRSRDNGDCSFGWGLRTPILGKRRAYRGSGMVPFERALVSSYRPSTVTFPLYLRVSEILPLMCYCSSGPLFPTPPLVSSKFPHVPLWLGGWPFDYEERRGLIVRAISFQDF